MTSKQTYAQLSYDVEFVPPAIFNSAENLHRYQQMMEIIGTKSHPHVDTSFGHQMHIDGISAEMAPIRPSLTADELIQSYRAAKAHYERLVGYELEGMDIIDLDLLPGFGETSTPWLWASAMTFGCSPDYQDGMRREVPGGVKSSNIREAGIHIHMDLHPEFRDHRPPGMIEMGEGEPTNARRVAQVAAEFAEAISFLYEPEADDLWYRQPRVYRPTTYGIEYRSIGASICNDEDRLYTLFSIAQRYMRDHFSSMTVR